MGSLTMALAMAIRCCWPPLKESTGSVLKAVQVYKLQGVADLVVNVAFGLFLDFQPEGGIFRNAHVREQGVLLKNGVQLPFGWGQAGNVLSAEQYLSPIRRLEAAR